ncbi:hypothetical protein BSKO_08444 [Bryopsis sp. KO-2023]|nr:hypothetical protein BSKO_08444 [Bryopsis sp. KO-2023]
MSFAHDNRIIIYPNYINKKKTVARGRRIPVEKACEDPTPAEILDVCKHLKLDAEVEGSKCYSREWWVRGRVRVQLIGDDGAPANPDLQTRRALMLRIAELVPKHPDRQKKDKPQPQQGKAAKKGKGKKGR